MSSLDRLAELAVTLLGADGAQVTTVGAGAAQEPVVVGTAGGPGPMAAHVTVPLAAAAGHQVGSLVAWSSSPRQWDEHDVATLERLAAAVVTELELAALSADYEAGQIVWQLAVDAAGIGAFDWDLRTGELRWDDRLLELFGLDRTTFGGTIDAFNETVHPEDLPRVTTALKEAVEAGGEYASEYRVVLPDGGVRWIAARGRALTDEDGTAVRVLGAAYDTTAAQEGEARVARVLEAMPTAFFHLDREWRFGYLNSEAERLLGRPRHELAGEVVWEAFPEAVGSDFESYYRFAADSGEPVAFDAYYPEPLDAWYEVRAWPTPDGLSVYFVDVSSRHEAQEQVARAARRSELLADVTERLTGTLDVVEAVGHLGALVVPALADWCIATMVEDPGHEGRAPTLRDIGGWHRDPGRQPLVDRYAAIRMPALTDPSFLWDVLASPRPLVAADGAAETLAGLFADGEARDLTRQLDPASAVVVTLRGRDRVLGLLTAFRDPGRGGFTEADVDTLGEVAARAGLALDNARLFAEQRALAEGLQRSLLTEPPQPDHLELVVRYEAAAQAAQVGGDWYDAFLQPEGGTVVVIGDVVGHDTAAAAAMGQLRSLLRGIAVHSGDGPADVLRGVDRVLETLQVDTTATAVIARLEQTPEERRRGTTRVVWSNAGHPPPAVVTPDGDVRLLTGERPDLLLGLDPETQRAESQVVLERGSTVLLFTDGLVERRGEDLEHGLARLRRELRDLDATGLPLEELCDQLVQRMVPDRLEDDVALVAVRLHPQAGSGSAGG